VLPLALERRGSWVAPGCGSSVSKCVSNVYGFMCIMCIKCVCQTECWGLRAGPSPLPALSLHWAQCFARAATSQAMLASPALTPWPPTAVGLLMQQAGHAERELEHAIPCSTLTQPHGRAHTHTHTHTHHYDSQVRHPGVPYMRARGVHAHAERCGDAGGCGGCCGHAAAAGAQVRGRTACSFCPRWPCWRCLHPNSSFCTCIGPAQSVPRCLQHKGRQ